MVVWWNGLEAIRSIRSIRSMRRAAKVRRELLRINPAELARDPLRHIYLADERIAGRRRIPAEGPQGTPADIDRWLAPLSRMHQTVFILCCRGRLSFDAVAERLQLPREDVARYLHESFRQIDTAIKGERAR